MELTRGELLALTTLQAVGAPEAYGLDLVRASGGKLGMGSVYLDLGRLQDRGYVDSRVVPNSGTIPRRAYKLTVAGFAKCIDPKETRH